MVDKKTNSEQSNGAAATAEQVQPEFAIQRIYIKDLSLEVPTSPAIFLEKWDPQVQLDIGVKNSSLRDDIHEVELVLTVTAKLEDKTAFLVEVKQAGIFSIKGFQADNLQLMLGAYCPNLLYPYAREVVTSTVVRAGFPQLYLSPINFDAMYEQQRQKQSAANSEPKAASGDTQA